MSAAKHTPGPWTVTIYPLDEDSQDLCAYVDSFSEPVAHVFCDLNLDRRDANARLIAAAPELFAALRDCAAVMQNDLNGLAVIQPELRAALAAIAKATGEAP